MAYNGLYGLLQRQYLAAELVERVEVLHGASAFLNGAAPGGSGPRRRDQRDAQAGDRTSR
jgi:iron complex outermembrane receptor protein